MSLQIEKTENGKELMKKLTGYTRDHTWIKENYKTLYDKHGERYIAVKNQKVVADGRSIEELREKLEPLGDLSDYTIEYLTEKDCNYLF